VLASRNDVRNRIEQLKLSHSGYGRQLTTLDLSVERRERLELDVRLLAEEISTLEKLAHLGRLEPDPSKVEASVRERLDALRQRLATDPSLSGFSAEERDQASGEVRALLWALGEDALTRKMRAITAGDRSDDPARIDRAALQMLVQTLQDNPEENSRAGAAYELGRLQNPQAIPVLAAALDDAPIVAEMALTALARFGDPQLREAGLPEELLSKIRSTRE
jgi:hypothetical protein